MTEEDIIYRHNLENALILGLKNEFFVKIEKDYVKYTKQLKDWIDFLFNTCHKFNMMEFDKNALVSMGFDPEGDCTKRILARSFEKSKGNHLEPYEWVDIFFKDEFKYNPLFVSKVPKFPFQSLLTDKWFKCKDESIDKDFKNVQIKNVDAEKTDVVSLLKECLPKDDREFVLFHGTDHESATNILERGIWLSAGRQKRDFSCGKGFYLSEDLQESFDWAKSTTSKPALLAFQGNSSFFSPYSKLNLLACEQKFYDIVSSFRSGRKTSKTRKSLEQYDYIEGPKAMVKKGADGETSYEMCRDKMQTCIISNELAEALQKELKFVIMIDLWK